jgi:polyisoprenoid-binding protein YceI
MIKNTTKSSKATRHVMATGVWRVDPTRSTVKFSARGFWGALPVAGRFADIAGTAVLDENGQFDGGIVIPAGTLDTGLKFRDRHLKSAAFFNVDRYPEIRFAARRLTATADGHVIEGTLSVRDRSVELTLPVTVFPLPRRRAELRIETALDRATLGLGHSPLGMIRGAATVNVKVVLEQDR